ncbi:MAG TPA: PLP-dependent aminotransferase family protein [Burkholderiaceae bacterium]|nr:PLP-dependent aminotransferase family protein [Burkholderiaceae bacterium]
MTRFASRLDNVQASAIRELFALLGKPGIISFAGGFPDAALCDAEGIAAASQQAISRYPMVALQYGASEGFAPLREWIAGSMSSPGAATEAARIVVTTGSQQAIDLLGKVLLEPGDVALVEQPTFLATIQAFRLYGARLIGIPTDADGADVDALERLIAQHSPKLVYLIPTFGNPSGGLMTQERRRRVVEIARHAPQTVFVEDNPYGELWFDRPPPASIYSVAAADRELVDRFVYLGSFSKILTPGLRCGWMAAPADLLARAVMVKQFADANTSTLAQVTTYCYLDSGRLPATVERVRRVYSDRARAMGDALDAKFPVNSLRFERPQGGLFYWVRVAGDVDAPKLIRAGVDRGVAVVPGSAFYAEQPDAQTMRLSFATAGSDAIEQGVARLADAYRELGGRPS